MFGSFQGNEGRDARGLICPTRLSSWPDGKMPGAKIRGHKQFLSRGAPVITIVREAGKIRTWSRVARDPRTVEPRNHLDAI